MRSQGRYGNGPHRPSEVAGDAVELDITPVMNMFIILIPFLVSMAVFTHVYVIDFGLPPNVGVGLDDSEGKPKLKVTVVVAPEFVAITQGENMLDSLPGSEDTFDYVTLGARLAERRETVDIKDEVVVAVRDAVRFQHVVRVMDVCRETGYEKIGLSSATEQPGVEG